MGWYSNNNINLVAQYSDKLYDPNPQSSGIAFCSSGGGAYSAVSTLSIYNGLYYGGVLNDKYIKYLSSSSGSGWATGLVSFISDNGEVASLIDILGPEINAENLKVSDFIKKSPKGQADYGFDDNLLITIFDMLWFTVRNITNLDRNSFFEKVLGYYVLRNHINYTDINIIGNDKQHLEDIINENPELERKLQDKFYVRPSFPYPITAFTVYYNDEKTKNQIFIPLEINPKLVSFLGTGYIPYEQDYKLFSGGISTYSFNCQYISKDDKNINCIQKINDNIFGLNHYVAGTSNLSKDILPSNSFLLPKMNIPLSITTDEIDLLSTHR